MFLRQTYRIVGSYIGTLVKAPRQVLMSGLPMLLSPEECDLLVSKSAISLLKFKNPDEFSEDYINKYKLYAEMNFQKQTEIFKEGRKREIDQMSDKIVEGKLKKRRKNKIDEDIEILEDSCEDLDQFKQSVIDTEIAKIPTLSRNNALIQTFQGIKYFGIL